MVDKPGVVTTDQLADMERAVAETGRIVGLLLRALFMPSVAKALAIVRAGGIGRVVQTLGLGPHRLNRAMRPSWFFDRATYGGILNDIASAPDRPVSRLRRRAACGGRQRQSASTAPRPASRISARSCCKRRTHAAISASIGSPPTACPPGATGGCSSGDRGHIELRKNVDIAGEPGGDHLFLVDETARATSTAPASR